MPEVACKHWLKLGAPASDKREKWTDARESREAIKKLVFLAENDRWSENDRLSKRRERCIFTKCLRLRVFCGRGFVSPNRRDVNQSLSAGLTGSARHVPCSFCVDGIECLRTSWGKNPNRVHDDVSALYSPRDRIWESKVCLDRKYLTNHPHGLQITREVWPSNRSANAIALPRKRPHDVTPDETGASENSG